jgi:hypothetical protein
MKRFVVLLLAVALAACSSPAPTEQPVAAPPEPTATPVVVVQTVVVEATQAPTDVPPPTAVPPTAAPVVVTVVVEPTQASAVQPQPTTAGGPIPIDIALGGGQLDNMSMSDDFFSLGCYPLDITFKAHSINPAIVDVALYYRIRDQLNNTPTQFISEWFNAGNMDRDGSGNFTIVFRGEQVNTKARWSDMQAWFDFQFVGLAKDGNVITRSEKITDLVTFAADCP